MPSRLFVVAFLAAAPALRAEDGSHWILRGHAVALFPTGDQVTFVRPGNAALGDERATHRVSESGFGLGVGLEYLWRPRVGIELGVFSVGVDNGFRLEAAGTSLADREEMRVTSYALGINWHFAPRGRAEVRAGAFLAQTTFADVTFLAEAGRREKLTFDDDYGWGAKAGIDLPLRRGSRWSLGAELRYLVTILESEVPGQDLDLDPLILSAGLGYRF